MLSGILLLAVVSSAWGQSVAPAATQSGQNSSDLRLQLSDGIGPVDNRVEQARNNAAESSAGQSAGAAGAAGAPPADTGLVLKLSLEYRHDGNLFSTAGNTESDFIRGMRPGLEWRGRIRKHELSFSWDGDLANHARFHREDYFNHDLDALARLDLHRKVKLNLGAELDFGTDARGGLTSRQTATGRPDRWRRHGIGASVEVGRRIATAQFRLGVERGGVRYLNNDQSVRDVDEFGTELEGAWHLSPRLSLLGQLGFANNDYQDPSVPLDSREYEALIGVEWEATAKTSGRVLIGNLWKDFDDPSRPGFVGRSWDVEVSWSPRTFSKLTAYASRDATESAFGGTGTAILDTFGLKWRHALSERLFLLAGAEFATSDLGGGRNEDRFSTDVGLTYTLTRWLDVSLSYEADRRQSEPGGADFGDRALLIRLDGRWKPKGGRPDS